MSWRQLYLRAIDSEIFLHEDEISLFMQTLCPQSDRDIGNFADNLDLLANWREHQNSEFRQILIDASSESKNNRLVSQLLLQSAPLGLVLGCWLQGMSAPGVFEDEIHLDLLSLLADDLAVGRPERSRKNEFRLLLQRHSYPGQSLSATSLAYCRDVDDAMFAMPSVFLAMSRRSDFFHAELCAVDFVMRSIGMLPSWDALSGHDQGPLSWERLNLRISGDPSIVFDPLEISKRIAARYRSSGSETKRKFDVAVCWTIATIKKWNDCLRRHSVIATNESHAMAELIRSRAREASVYHKAKTLDGCPLSSQFEVALTDPRPLLETLAKSRYVKPGNSNASPLTNGLISPRGPMFRIFTKHELVVIREWIDGLVEKRSGTDGSLEIADPKHLSQFVRCDPAKEHGAYPRSIREAYFLLQGRALTSKTKRYAHDYVKRWLKNSSHVSVNKERQLPDSWSPNGLKGWLLDQHDLHGRNFERTAQDDVTAPRHEVVESTLQLAPLILIDGSWLQGFTDVELACSEVGRALFEIYWDELGNGKIELNHPKIYRDLLASMDVRLPQTGSWQFAQDTRIKDNSYRLPVYWLCLGKLPLTYMPEILGMNLAMELSGVGDGYREARRLLVQHDFSTQFVDLHNTIDNVATGHSAWAADAIDKYMRGISQYRNEKFARSEWRRICTGYASLSAVPPKNKSPFSALKRIVFRSQESSQSMPSHTLHHYIYSNGIA